jgi:hypothetical protein
MASVVTICNMALGRIGIDQTIENIDDNNLRARMCKLYFNESRDQVLSDFDWNFASKVVPAGLLVQTPPPGWQFSYAYPTDCITVRALSTEAGLRLPSWYGMGCEWGDDALLAQWQRRVPFQVKANPDTTGRIIVTDLEDAYVWYTMRVTDPNQFTPQFVSALAWRLAAEIGGPLKASASMVQNAMNMAISVTGQAAADAYNEDATEDRRVSPSVSGRN